MRASLLTLHSCFIVPRLRTGISWHGIINCLLIAVSVFSMSQSSQTFKTNIENMRQILEKSNSYVFVLLSGSLQRKGQSYYLFRRRTPLKNFPKFFFEGCGTLSKSKFLTTCQDLQIYKSAKNSIIRKVFAK